MPHHIMNSIQPAASLNTHTLPLVNRITTHNAPFRVRGRICAAKVNACVQCPCKRGQQLQTWVIICA